MSPDLARRRDWDAATYDLISDIQVGWAVEQLSRLPLRGDEVVLDAGCGSGRVTALLADLVPRGRVYGVDVSESMVEHARGALGARATVLRQDLVELDLPEPVDAVFSNATFHWIHDHDALFAALWRATRPGGRLVAQCGGRGNIDALRAAADSVALEDARFARYFAEWTRPWNYAGNTETAARLERAGFISVETWLEPKRVVPQRTFVETVCLIRHLDPLPETLHEAFVDAVLEQLEDSRAARFSEAGSRAGGKREGEPLVLDYVRLNMTARRP